MRHCCLATAQTPRKPCCHNQSSHEMCVWVAKSVQARPHLLAVHLKLKTACAQKMHLLSDVTIVLPSRQPLQITWSLTFVQPWSRRATGQVGHQRLKSIDDKATSLNRRHHTCLGHSHGSFCKCLQRTPRPSGAGRMWLVDYTAAEKALEAGSPKTSLIRVLPEEAEAL
mmetsp:Transcript_24587/g.68442  ORF Transcript_24587/g.68442 Transcript_24587/m.68442 type:complete len:169 (-) Transcript_24587:1040-1546(-)